MRELSRRGFLSAGGLALGALPLIRSVDALSQAANPVFRHGVASGDPLADRVVIWTRVTTTQSAPSVAWTVARDEKMAQVVARGEAQTAAARDFSVKVDVTGLDPATTYYYRFATTGEQSPVGRTKTLPRGSVSRVRIGVVSCSNLPQGFFNAYACLALRRDLDAILHLGDYIYEYANAQYGDGSKLGRIPAPNKEMVTLAEYRQRHAQYKADPDSQAVHQAHPFICVWDDHEFTNNSWSGGAQNHNNNGEDEGSWTARRAAALQAYLEWMPIRNAQPALDGKIYRSFRFGDLASLIMLDTRIIGRDEQAGRDNVEQIESATRQLLGPEQEGWLAEQFTTASRNGARWTLLGQQVVFAPQTPARGGSPNTDSWDGYRGARRRVFDMVERAKIDNFAVLTGDIHSSWAYDLPRDPFAGYDKATGKGSLGVEFAGTSVTSPSNVGRDGEAQLAQIRNARPHLHYVDGRYRGYFVVDLTRERLQADYYAVATIQERSTKERFEKGFITESGRNHLVEASTPVS